MTGERTGPRFFRKAVFARLTRYKQAGLVSLIFMVRHGTSGMRLVLPGFVTSTTLAGNADAVIQMARPNRTGHSSSARIFIQATLVKCFQLL